LIYKVPSSAFLANLLAMNTRVQTVEHFVFTFRSLIANAKNMDYNAAKAIKELLEQGPRKAEKDLMDWEVEEFEGENILFYKTMCQSMRNSEGKLSEDTTIIQQQDILENFKHLMRSRNIIGGQGFESLSRTTSKDVEHVNN
jgi:hypothetical protein